MTSFCCRNFYVNVLLSLPSEPMGSNRIFEIFNTKWSCDKMPINWVRSGRTGSCLVLGQEVHTSLSSVSKPCSRAKYFPVGPSHSVNKYIFRFLDEISSHVKVFISNSIFYFPTLKEIWLPHQRDTFYKGTKSQLRHADWLQSIVVTLFPL